MAEQTEQEFQVKIDELNKRIETLKQEKLDLLTMFNLAIIDTRDDMRIVNSFGATEVIFADAGKNLQNGENLIKLVYKTTKNTAELDETYQGQDSDKKNIEDTISDFISSSRTEKAIKIVGEKDDGELFLLEWKITRIERYIRSFFTIIPSNNIVKSVQDKLNEELIIYKKIFKQVLNIISEGVTVLDIKTRISFINDFALKSFISKEKTLLQNTNFEGRAFKELFISDDIDDQHRREYFNKEAIITRQMQSYTFKVDGLDYRYDAYPLIGENKSVNGIIIISRLNDIQQEIAQPQTNNTKLISTLKLFAEENKFLKERETELENNQKWFMKNNKEYQDTIKLIYSFLEKLPIPVSILQLPSLKFDFVNKAFESHFQIRREQVNKKEDKDIFPPEINIILSSLNSNSSKTKEIIEVNNNLINIRQVTLYNNNNNPTHILRVYTK